MRSRCFLKRALKRYRGRGWKSGGRKIRDIDLGKDREQRSWVGGRVTEWVNRDEAGELVRQRVGWKCGTHGWAYWAREIRWGGRWGDGENERF